MAFIHRQSVSLSSVVKNETSSQMVGNGLKVNLGVFILLAIVVPVDH